MDPAQNTFTTNNTTDPPATRPAENDARFRAVCEYFRKGSCLRLNCRYFHGTEEQRQQQTDEQHSEAPSGTGDPTTAVASAVRNVESLAVAQPTDSASPLTKRQPIVCLSYLSGKCDRPNCRFTHLPPHVRPVPPSVCTYFQEGSCHREVCRFFHGTQSQLEQLKHSGTTFYNPATLECYNHIDRRVNEQLDESSPASPASSSMQQQPQQQTNSPPSIGTAGAGKVHRGHHPPAQPPQQPPQPQQQPQQQQPRPPHHLPYQYHHHHQPDHHHHHHPHHHTHHHTHHQQQHPSASSAVHRVVYQPVHVVHSLSVEQQQQMPPAHVYQHPSQGQVFVSHQQPLAQQHQPTHGFVAHQHHHHQQFHHHHPAVHPPGQQVIVLHNPLHHHQSHHHHHHHHFHQFPNNGPQGAAPPQPPIQLILVNPSDATAATSSRQHNTGEQEGNDD